MLGPSTERDAAPAALRRPALQAILDAGLETFAATGFHGASVRDIARAAETSLSNLYNYFPSKEDLLVAVLKDANEELRAQVDEAIHAAPAVATQQAMAAVGAYVRFAVDNQEASIISITEIRYLTGEKRASLVSRRDDTQQIFEEIIQAGLETREFSTASAKDAARAIISMCLTIASWYKPGGPHTVEDLQKIYQAYALGILRSTVR